MAYRTAAEITKEEAKQARVLAIQLKEKIEKHFPEPHNPVAMAEIKAIRRELEEMGFCVGYKLTINSELKVEAEVTISTVRSIN